MSLRLSLAALALGIALGSSAYAHELGMVQVEGTFRKDGTYVVDLLVDSEHLPPRPSRKFDPAAVMREIEERTQFFFDGILARRGKGEIQSGIGEKPGDTPGITRLRFVGRTPPAVTQFTFANDAITGFFVVRLGNENEGQEAKVTQWVEGGKASAPFVLDRAVVPSSRWEIIKLYLALGFTHILPRGLDHVLFVLGIFLLAAELRPVLWQVSAFTLAHTITLALTVYGVVSLPPSVVEPLIALSIVYVAIENVFTARLHSWRPLVVFCFGLLHGMGFAGVLTGIGLPRSEFVPALLSFNAGVECGQLTVIFAAMLAFGLWFRNKPWYRRRIVIPGSLAIAAVGLYWSVERGFFAK